MILGVIKRISKDDLSKAGQLPPWIDALLSPLNDFIEKVGLSLQNRLTFKNNMLGKVIEITFADSVAQEVNPYPGERGSLQIAGVTPMSTGGVFLDSFKWVKLNNGNISVTVRLTGATAAKIKLHIHLE